MTARPIRLLLAAAALALALAPVSARAGDPLAITVVPSGFESPAVEAREALLERRLRQSDALFRSICRGCARPVAGLVETTASFDPQAVLSGRGRARPSASAGERRDVAEGGVVEDLAVARHQRNVEVARGRDQ